MSSVSFSLTDRYICSTVGNLRAGGLSKTESWISRLEKFAQEELLARIVAIPTSVFCAADTIFHVGSGIAVGGYSLLGRVNIVRKSDQATGAVALAHFRQAGKYAIGTAFGSIAGVIYPDALEWLQSHEDFSTSENIIFSEKALKHIDEKIGKYWPDPLNPRGAFQSGFENGPVHIGAVKWEWSQWKLSKNLDAMKVFVDTFNTDQFLGFKRFREAMASTVYRQPGPRWKKRKVCWLTNEEIKRALQQPQSCWSRFIALLRRCFRISKCAENIFLQNARFFHETTPENLRSILSHKKILVKDDKAYEGAWSSVPKFTGLFGTAKLVLKSTEVERSSTLLKGFTVGKEYWADFSQPIPVTETTLAGIILENPEQGDIETLEKECQELTGRKITVISLKDAIPQINALNALQMGIPEEWPEEDFATASATRVAMRALMPPPPPSGAKSRLRAMISLAAQERKEEKASFVAVAQSVTVSREQQQPAPERLMRFDAAL